MSASHSTTWPYRLVHCIDTLNLWLGKSVAWLTVLMVLATCIVVVLRRGFDIGSIALQESVTYMHAAVFLLGMAFALKQGAHVRVDIFYARFSTRQQAWIDCLGSLLFTLPIAIFIAVISWDFVLGSWAIQEVSADSGGVGAVYLLKALIPLMAVSLGLQACAELIRNLLLLMGITPAERLPGEQLL
jgi:TRAP-type mannitol/chloroaromatic compound transport system permease small subunit